MNIELGERFSGFLHEFKVGFSGAKDSAFKISTVNAPALRTLSLTAASFLFGLVVGKAFLPVNTTTAAELPPATISAEEKSLLKKLEVKELSLANFTPAEPKPTTTTASAKPAKNNTVKIGDKTLPLRAVSNTNIESGPYVNFLSEYNFTFAHNYILPNLSSVKTFQITRNNKTTAYRVVKSVTIKKSKINMPELVYGEYAGESYDLVLMTCAGKSLSGGDSTHRLVLFMDKL